MASWVGGHWAQCVTRGQKVQSRREREIWNCFLQFREEKEKFENPFPSFEKRKRNLKKDSQLSRRERERNILFSSFKRRKRKWKLIHHFREETGKFEMLFSNSERRKRNLKTDSPLSRQEREMKILFSSFKRRKRILKTNSPNVFSNFSSNRFPERMHSHIGCICLSFLHCVSSDVSSNHLPIPLVQNAKNTLYNF